MKSLEDLARLRDEVRERMKVREGARAVRITVGMGTCGIAAGARDVMNALLDELAKRGLTDVTVTQTGCAGLCEYEPLVEVARPGQPKVTYSYVTPEKIRQIVAQHVVNGQIIGEWVLAAR